jgi:hypothetical protein
MMRRTKSRSRRVRELRGSLGHEQRLVVFPLGHEKGSSVTTASSLVSIDICIERVLASHFLEDLL